MWQERGAHLHPLDDKSWNACLRRFRTRDSEPSTDFTARRNGPGPIATDSSCFAVFVSTTGAFVATETNVNGDAREGLLSLDNPLGCVKVIGQHATELGVPVLDASPNLKAMRGPNVYRPSEG